MISSNSKWDTAYAQVFAPNANNRGLGASLPGFTAQEDRGRQLFITPPNAGGGGCAVCHQPPSFALAANSRSNGLDAGETVIFKSPSLKNVGLSKAFMHDGRFDSLDKVVEHYNSGVKLGPALDNRLSPNGQALRLNLSTEDKAALGCIHEYIDGFNANWRMQNSAIHLKSKPRKLTTPFESVGRLDVFNFNHDFVTTKHGQSPWGVIARQLRAA
jgi:hypothetical protein